MIAIVCIITAAALLLWPTKVEREESVAPKRPRRPRKEPKS